MTSAIFRQIYSWGSQSIWDCYLWKIPLSRPHSLSIANSYLCQCMCRYKRDEGKEHLLTVLIGKFWAHQIFISIILGSFCFCVWAPTDIFYTVKSMRGIWPTKLTQVNYIVDQYMPEGSLGYLYIFYLVTSERERAEVYILHMFSSIHKAFYIFVHSSGCA